MSKIEWTDETWNPVTGCSRVSDGCDNCYAMQMARRLDGRELGYDGTTRNKDGVDWTGKLNLLPGRLEEPLSWTKPRKVFVCSMGDLFHPAVPDSYIDRVFAVMALARNHTFQILTKRPERMQSYLTEDFQADRYGFIDTRPQRIEDAVMDLLITRDALPGSELCKAAFLPSGGARVKEAWPLPNVWLGTSVEHQEAADERIPHLLKCPAAVRFLSCEPLLGPLNITDQPWWDWRYTYPIYPEGMARRPIDWVIAGGESGPGARPMHPDWVISIRDQCHFAEVPFFFKQWGAWVPSSCVPPAPDTGHYAWPWAEGETGNLSGDTTMVVRTGKREAGRELDGREWNEMPEVQ